MLDHTTPHTNLLSSSPPFTLKEKNPTPVMIPTTTSSLFFLFFFPSFFPKKKTKKILILE